MRPRELSHPAGNVLTVTVLEALERAIDQAKNGDPLAPVTVVPPNVYAGLSLRRTLARRVGLVNTRFMPLARVAELLGAGTLAGQGKRPLTGPVGAAAIRAVLDADPGAFKEVAHSTATVDALESAFRELAPLDESQLDTVAATGTRASELVRLLRAWRERRAEFYDEPALALAAAEAVREGVASLQDLGTVLLYMPLRIGPADQPLLDALRAAGRLEVVEAWLDDTPPPVDRIVIAPTPEEEVRVAVRDLPHLAAEGTPLHRVAFVSHDTEPYATIAADVLAEASIPCHGASTRTLAHTVAGRVLLGLLALPGQRYARRDVTAWLHAGPIHRDGHAVPADRWDRRSRQAGVTSGQGQWSERLSGMARRMDERATLADYDDDPERRDQLTSAAGEARQLSAFMTALFQDMRPPTARTWAGWAEWAVGLLHRYLGGETAHAPWPDHEIEAFRSVEAALESLAILDGLEQAPDLGGFLGAVERELRGPAPRTTRFGDGVFVGRVSDLVGTEFDAVYVFGMVEGSFPSRVPGGLVSESERAAAGEALDSVDEIRSRERRTWLAALKTPRHRVLLAPAGDPRAGRPRQPAPWLLEAAQQLAGHTVYAETLRDITAPWLEVVRSADDGMRRARTPASLAERDTLAVMAAESLEHLPHLPHLPHLARGFDAVRARAGVGAGPWEGFVDEVDGLFSDRVLSATSLEKYAACPFSYFLEHLLRLDVLDDPEEIETLAPKDRGSLIHKVLEQFIKERGGDLALGSAWGPDDVTRLFEIAEEQFDEWEGRGRTGLPILWTLEKRRIRRILERFVAADDAERSAFGMRTTDMEFAFAGADGLEVPLDDGRVVHIRGYIDRIDASDDLSRVRVIDYKTGRPMAAQTKDPFASGPFLGGTKLQLAVYALAAKRKYPQASVRADYWYVSDRSPFKTEGYDVTDEVSQEFTGLLSRIVRGIEAGVFPARPGDDSYRPSRGATFTNCAICDYDRVCTTDRADAWERLRDQPEVEPYRAVAESGEDESGEDT